MAKSSTEGKASGTAARERKRESPDGVVVDIADLIIRPGILLFADLERGPMPEDTEGKREEGYLAAVTEITEEGGFLTAICHLRARHTIEDKGTFSLSAYYLLGFHSPQRLGRVAARQLTKQVLSAAVWPRFGDLLAVMAGQAGVELPKLPYEPKITWPEQVKKTSAEKE